MNFGSKFAMTLVGAAISASMCSADTLPTHRIPVALAIEAASETIAASARQGYRETAVVLDADGATIVAVRGDGAGIHTLDSAHDKAYTSVSFKNDTIALAERAKGEDGWRAVGGSNHEHGFQDDGNSSVYPATDKPKRVGRNHERLHRLGPRGSCRDTIAGFEESRQKRAGTLV